MNKIIKNIQIFLLVVFFVMKNNNQKEKAMHVDKAILRQKMTLVNISNLKKNEVLHEINLKEIDVMKILFVRIIQKKKSLKIQRKML